MTTEDRKRVSGTATDMANFMIAHLHDGQFGDTHILHPASARDMRQQYYAFHPQLPDMTRGFAEAYRNNNHWVFHPGTTDLSSSLLALLPDQNVGIFMVFNSSISTPPRLALVHALLDRYYPATTSSSTGAPAVFSDHSALAGSYLTTRRAESNIEKMISSLYQVSVTSNPDNTLTVDAVRDSNGMPIRWAEVEPRVFQEVGG